MTRLLARTRRIVAISILLIQSKTACALNDVPNLPEAGRELGAAMANYLQSADAGQAHMLVAAFRFGNEANIVPQELGVASLQLQGHLTEALVRGVKEKNLSQKYTVLDAEGIDSQTGGSIILRYQDSEFTRVRAAQKNIAVPIVGTFIRSSDSKWYDISAKVITPASVSPVFSLRVRADGVSPFIPGNPITPLSPPDEPSKPSGRFSVEMFAKAKDEPNFSKLGLQQAEDQTGKFRNVLFLKVDRSRFFGQPYEIHIKNHESKKFVLPEPGARAGTDDADRVFGAAVFIDGVASVMREEQTMTSTSYKRDIRHPAYVGKHILTASTRVFRTSTVDSSDGRFLKSYLENYTPPGHSEWRIRGFQKGTDTAATFLFGTAGQSVGTGLGQNVNQIGLISIYFYAEALDGDEYTTFARTYTGATEVGPDQPSPVIHVGVQKYYPIPAEVWHIRYVYSDDPDAPPVQPITPGG